MARARPGNFALALLGASVLSGAYLFFARVGPLPAEKIFAAIYHKAVAVFYLSLLDLFKTSILAGAFWGAILVTLGLQRLVPAKPGQKIFSPSFAQDLVWVVYQTVLQALIVVTYVDLLIWLYGRYFSFLTITSLSQFPGWVRLLAAVLLVDFLYWSQHYFNHKVPFLWRFHSLHHSQRELNFFTDFRYHFLEYIVRHTFLVIPLLILRVEMPMIVALLIFQRWYSRFYHGNIKTDLGPLRYILVTPQSHRVHHSVEPEHRDTNFGALLSIWDFAMGTQHRNYDVYPDTGIADPGFPHEKKVQLKSLLLTPLVQMLYPFLTSSKPLISNDPGSRTLGATAPAVAGDSSFHAHPDDL